MRLILLGFSALCDIELTKRQKELLLWLAKGMNNAAIAEKMGISYATVSHHLKEIKKRLKVRNSREILPKALAIGLIESIY